MPGRSGKGSDRCREAGRDQPVQAQRLGQRDREDHLRILDDSRTDPRNVRFEITETAAIENLDAARSLVVELKKMGCAVSLDDFGTGYGSFTYVRQLPRST